MKKTMTAGGWIIAAAVLLSAMGCWFCWYCPSKIYGPHGLFWRQLAWCGIGLASFAAAWLIGWKRLLKIAPWLMLAWLAAFAVARFSLPVRGARRWLTIGCVRVNVVTLFVPVLALFVAWLHEKKWLRPWMELSAIVVAALGLVWLIFGSEVRLERLSAFFNPDEWAQDRAYMSNQLVASLEAANWFGYAGQDVALPPCPESDGMISASALLFGKWFPGAVAVLFAAIVIALAILWKGAAETPKRRYILVFGLWLIVPAAYCVLQSFGLLPVAGMSPALASYGGTATVMAWFGIAGLRR